MIEGVLDAAGTPYTVEPCEAHGEHITCAYQLTPVEEGCAVPISRE
jgi:hypothetical protein